MKCVIVGCGGHGRVVLDILMAAGEHNVVGFLDSNPEMSGRRIDGRPVLGDLSVIGDLRVNHGVEAGVVAIGDNGVRRHFAEQCEGAGLRMINAIHPSANIALNATLGCNVVIAAGALVCAHCQIGDSVILNTGSIVDHESMIGTAVHVCPGARLAGRVTVESGAFIGIGATIIQSLRIGYEAKVGAGAVVTGDVAPMSTVVGVPAREICSVDTADDRLDVHEQLVRHDRPDQIDRHDQHDEHDQHVERTESDSLVERADSDDRDRQDGADNCEPIETADATDMANDRGVVVADVRSGPGQRPELNDRLTYSLRPRQRVDSVPPASSK
jgi:sugar O-acyltransferase (sialic acid O-acetyltransferase NeuD family)